MLRWPHIVIVLTAVMVVSAVAGAEQASTKRLSPEDQYLESQIRYYISALDPVVSLTDEQKKTIREIFEDLELFSREFRAKNRAAMEAIHKEINKAYEQQDQETANLLQEKYVRLVAPMTAVQNKAYSRFDRLLTPEQKAKQREHELKQIVKQWIDPAELTPGQMKMLKALVGNDSPGGHYSEIQQTLAEMLTPGQKAGVAKRQAMETLKYVFAQARLTAEQLQKAEAACDVIVKDGSLDQAAVNQQLREKVEVMLTPVQKAAYFKAQGRTVE